MQRCAAGRWKPLKAGQPAILDRLRADGFTDDQIRRWTTRVREQSRAACFANSEINDDAIIDGKIGECTTRIAVG